MPPLPTPEPPPPAAAPEEPPRPVAPPKPAPKPEVKPETALSPPPAKPAPGRPEECPRQPAAWEAPEVVLLLDASGSMGLPVDLGQAEVERLYRRAAAGDQAAVAELRALLSRPGANRLDAAKRAAKEVVAGLPSAVDVGLVVFGNCRGAENHKFFSAGERGRFAALIDGVRPMQGTPLARGLERAGAMMDGETVPGVVVVVTDGADSCGGDPCAAARALHAAKPRIRVNVVDVNGDGAGRCMAEATGGKLLSVQDYARLADVLQRGTGQPRVPESCR